MPCSSADSIHKAKLCDRTLWMGGSPCSGKSSIVALMAERYHLIPYHCDDHWDEHTERATPDVQPHMSKIPEMSWDEIWMREVDVQVAYEIAIYREEFPMIMDDLAQLPKDKPILAEGAALLPECVAHWVSDPHQAIWIVPTEAFQRRIYPERGPWVNEILSHCQQPEAAFERWMARDAAFGRLVAKQAKALGFRVLWVDGARSLEENARIVQAWFAPHLIARHHGT